MTATIDPTRGACAGCGLTFDADDLFVLGEERLCARCYALLSPAGAGGVAGSGPWSEAASRATSASVAGHVPGAPAAGARPGSGVGGLRGLEMSVRAWADGRYWWVRAPLLVWLAWILVHYWSAPWYHTVWGGLDLAVHEIGHILWAPLGDFAGVAGGTLTQCLVPVAAGVVLYRQRDWFGVAVAVAWLGINCFEIVEYAGDAVARQLPLVSPFTGSPMHDWSYMLGRLGLLRRTTDVAAAWQWGGRLFMSTGIAFGAWVLWIMGRARERPAPGPEPVGG